MPSQAQALEDISLAKKSGVGVGWQDSELSPFLKDGNTRSEIKNTDGELTPPLRGETGLIHSQENQDFVGVVPPCRPCPTHDLLGVFGIGATTGGLPLQRMKQPGENLSYPLPVPTFSLAQRPRDSQDIPTFTPVVPPKRSGEPLPERQPPSPPPTPQQVLPSAPPPPPTTAEPVPGNVPESITIKSFEFEGNTAISDEELAEATKNFIGRSLSFAEVYEVRSIITKLYKDRGYVSSGAIIPPQTFRTADSVVKIQIIEGGLQAIEVRGTRRLNPEYIRSRLIYAAGTPVNQKALIEALQLLQLDPLIKSISAELSAGTGQGSSLLIVKVEEAKTLHLDLSLNNNRSPNIGSVERRLQLSQANLFGEGDGLIVGFANTAGSNTLDTSYTYPLNPRNGTLNLTTSFTLSNVVESPFDRIDLDADSRYFGLTWRQPQRRSLSGEYAIGLSLTNQRSKVTVFDVPVRLSPGAEEDGSTTVTALRFFQEWTNSSGRHVFGLRSQFNLGLGLLGGTTNEDEPDSKFLSWRGQVQWVELLARDTLFVLRGDVQVSSTSLLNLEKFGLGGRDTVRGYRQNVLLTDSGAAASAEVRFPILRLPRQNALLQLAPFIDMGFVWNYRNNLIDPEPDPNFLASIGLGLRFQMGDRLGARLDWGLPLIDTDINSENKTLQEEGFNFSVFYRIF